MLWSEAIAIGMEFFSAAAEHLMFNQAHHDEATFQPSITVGSQSVPELGYATWLHFNLDTAKARSRSFVSMCWAMHADACLPAELRQGELSSRHPDAALWDAAVKDCGYVQARLAIRKEVDWMARRVHLRGCGSG